MAPATIGKALVLIISLPSSFVDGNATGIYSDKYGEG
jgi:hypothetical protein